MSHVKPTFTFVDTFDQPTTNWRRGDVIFSNHPGPLLIHYDDGDLRNHITLSGTAVHPDVLRQFRLSLTFSLRDAEPGHVVFAFVKPHEWSRTEEAPIQMHMLPSGRFSIHDSTDRRLAEGELSPKHEDRWTLHVERTADAFTVRAREQTLTVPWPGPSAGGYFTARVFNNAMHLHRVELSAPHAPSPLTESQRRDDINAWLRWRMDQNHRDVDRIIAFIAQARDSGQWGYNTDIQLTPGLVRPGERVQLRFTCSRTNPDLGKATMQEDYLAENPGPVQDLALNWQKCGPDAYEARLDLTAGRPGNARILWTIGPEVLSRVFAVLDRGYAVCTLWAGSNRPDVDQELHRFGLPGDYWIDYESAFDQSPPRLLDRLRNHARMRHHYGDTLVPFINGAWAIPGCPNTNLFQLSDALQEEAFRLTIRLWEALGFPRPDMMGSYTLGHTTIPAARRAGFKAINSLCQWQNYLDGGSDNDWKINHWAAPIAPYFAADDDFRKVAPEKSVVMFGMGTASSVRSYTIFSMEGCPSLCYPGCRYTQEAETANIHRFYHAVDNWLADVANNSEPLFFTVGIENFLRKPDWARANELGVEYLVRRARTAKLLFASAADVADFYLRTYTRQPAHVYYQPDTYCGYREAKKPARLPDRIEFSDHRMHSLHGEGESLPTLLWDFTRPWSAPEWDSMEDLRQGTKLVTPEQVRDGRCVPPAVNLTNVRARVDFASHSNGVDLRLHLDTPEPLPFLPIVAWNVPLDPDSVTSMNTPPDMAGLKVKDHATGNLHALLICTNVPAGSTERIIRLTGTSRVPAPSHVVLAEGKIGAKTFYLQGTPYTYLWRTDQTSPGTFEIPIPAGKNVHALYNDRDHAEFPLSGRLRIRLDDTWPHQSPVIVGESANDLAAASFVHGST